MGLGFVIHRKLKTQNPELRIHNSLPSLFEQIDLLDERVREPVEGTFLAPLGRGRTRGELHLENDAVEIVDQVTRVAGPGARLDDGAVILERRIVVVAKAQPPADVQPPELREESPGAAQPGGADDPPRRGSRMAEKERPEAGIAAGAHDAVRLLAGLDQRGDAL